MTHQRVERVTGNLDHFTVLERDRVTAVNVGPQAVNTQDLTCHVKTSDLFASILGEKYGLERARMHAEQGVELRAVAIQVVAAAQPAALAAHSRHQQIHRRW